MKRMVSFVALMLLGSCLSSCSNDSGGSTTAGTTGSMADPKSSLSRQLDLVKSGDATQLKECFTPRLRERITQDVVDKARADSAKYTLDDLYASQEDGESEGKKTAKVKMKNGRTLTTLIETDGKWLSDTIWFK